MTDEIICPKCRSPLPADSPAGICPKCLMEGGLATTIGTRGSASELPEPGQTFGPYRIGAKLGSGGMGAVYVAEHIESGRRLALKVLNHRLESSQLRQRFLREGRLAAAISHPHSVYIYGTDEIDGAPVIAMELAAGGTLQERVQRDGPLGVGQAVDVILQIIDGLEAAAAAGVLHRDVKPANCFFDADGTVKVGDFGLSISTTPRADTNLTQTGIFLGTPAFSSPEQLRGDELDVRSDIYSVGVTLFYLLTGRMPFEGKQMVQLLATVLEQPAPSPIKYKPELPAGLAKVVEQCLAKRSTQRYASYADLRRALLPYATAAPSPATLGFRMLAFVVDTMVLWAIAALIPLLWARDLLTWSNELDVLITAVPEHESAELPLAALGALLPLVYFAVLEGRWGTTAGKSLCRLRVVDRRREPPGLWRAVVRTCVFYIPVMAPYWIHYAVDLARGTRTYDDAILGLLAISVVLQLALFVTARRSNGYAGLHELASGTRVVRNPLHQQRPVLELEVEPLPECVNKQSLGPYQVLGPIISDPGAPITLAYDARLLRRVWIRGAADNAPTVPQSERGLSRAGRLRWLGGVRSAAGSWDAYEAPSGKPLLDLIQTKPSWDAVRFWLFDLAEELTAAQADGTLPHTVQLDRVWITAEGRAKLLDFPAPGLSADRSESKQSHQASSTSIAPAMFLKQVAVSALEGAVVPIDQVAARNVSLPMPVSAREMVNRLGQSLDTPLPLAELRTFTLEAAAVSQAKRVAIFAACWLVPLAFTALGGVMFFAERQFLASHPAAGELAGYVDFYRSGTDNAQLRRAVRIVVSHDYRDTVENTRLWSSPGMNSFLDSDSRALVEHMLSVQPHVDDEQLSAARKQLAPYQTEIRARSSVIDDEFYSTSMPVFLIIVVGGILLLFVMIPSMLCVLVAGNSLLLRSLDIALVNRRGEPASRTRVLWRNAVLWTLVLAALGLLLFVAFTGRLRPPVFFLLWAVMSMFLAERGLHDRLAGTWLVPR